MGAVVEGSSHHRTAIGRCCEPFQRLLCQQPTCDVVPADGAASVQEVCCGAGQWVAAVVPGQAGARGGSTHLPELVCWWLVGCEWVRDEGRQCVGGGGSRRVG